MEADMSLEQYFKFIPSEKISDKILVSFSSASAVDGFDSYKTLNSLGVNNLFVRDISRSWYNGSNPYWDSIYELAQKINMAVKEFDKEKIYFTGSSMGAYAAIAISSILGFGKVLAFSPQARLESHIPNTPDQKKISLDIPYLSKLKVDSSRCAVFFGLTELSDYIHASELMKADVKVSYVIFASHNIPIYLSRLGILKKVYSDFLNDKVTSIPSECVIDTVQVNKLAEVISRLYQSTKDDVSELLENVADFPYSHILDYVKIKFSKPNDLIHFELENIVCRNIPLFINDQDFLFSSYKAFFSIGEFALADEMLVLYRYSLPKVNWVYYHERGKIHLKNNELSKALVFQKQAAAMHHNPNIGYQIGLLLCLQKKYSDAIIQLEKSLKEGCVIPTLNKHLVTAYRNEMSSKLIDNDIDGFRKLEVRFKDLTIRNANNK
ncbi:tetratricopeptide repeat protein [Enterovibrio norvegicus]|uniref:tetratricopeptide repeat protein n=1 Tax=Enterovibrio norvegicus TaxID=188144 RepID=UPI000C82EBB6|nr:hypothetical protein [Enterovibrio norvegicus]PMI30209.1 hypothetical protein BCU47_18675 [Enterovibrio norvegicus]